jgi:hypothetical protein
VKSLQSVVQLFLFVPFRVVRGLLSRAILSWGVLLFVCASVIADDPKVDCVVDDNGMTSLTCDGVEFLRNGHPEIPRIFFSDDKDADVPADTANPTISFEKSAQRLSYSWPWGAVRYRYRLAGNRLNIDLTIENDTAGPLSRVDLDLLELQFPRRPAGSAWEQRLEMLGDNVGDITAIMADYRTGALTFCNDDPAAALWSGFTPAPEPGSETWKLRVASLEPYTPQQRIFVEPRSTKTFHFSLRFTASGLPVKTVVADLMDKFVAVNPFQLKWPDRRPIGQWSLTGGSAGSPTNPRGWFGDSSADFTGVFGAKRFHVKVLEAADQVIAVLKEMGAQGVILQDMEGHEWPSLQFVGDPRITADLAPEMGEVAPELFARFHKAGLRTGVCIRPSRILPGGAGKSKWQHTYNGFDVVDEMSEKIAFAKKNLGCLLFYVDSNARYRTLPDGTVESRLLEPAVFKRLAEAHPDVLLIPQLPRLAYWSCAAPCLELRPGPAGNHAATDARVLDFYPRAFSVINPIDGPAEERRAEIVAGQRRGDTMLFRCGAEEEQNKVLKAILEKAAGK